MANIPGFDAYYSDAAYDLAEWAIECNNRIKASKLKKIADKMEAKKRDNRPVYTNMVEMPMPLLDFSSGKPPTQPTEKGR